MSSRSRPRWRELEEAVAVFEMALRGTGYSVTSPDFLLDATTGAKREVDAAIRRSTDDAVVAIVECRNRNAAQAVTWVEQAITKGRDLGVPEVILVSARGFQSGAQAKAAHYGLKTRMVTKVRLEDVRDWFQVGSATVIQRKVVLLRYDLRFDIEATLTPESLDEVKTHGLSAPILFRGDGLPALSVGEVFRERLPWIQERISHQQLPDTPGRMFLPPLPIVPEEPIFVRTTQGDQPLSFLVLHLALDVDTKQSAAPALRDYVQDANALAQSAEVQIPLGHGDETLRISFIHDEATGETKGFIEVPAGMPEPSVHLIEGKPPKPA